MRSLCFGEALVDLVCERPVHTPAEVHALVPHLGGSLTNVAVGAARRGARVALAGGVGSDPWGVWVRERLAAEGVELDFFGEVQAPPAPPTAVALVTVDEDAQPTFVIHGEGISAAVDALGDRLLEAVDACDALVLSSNTMVGPNERELTLAARERALSQGKPFIFDPNLRAERWESSLAAVQVVRPCVEGALLVKLNADESRVLTGEREPERAAAALLSAGAQHVVVTLGAHGALLRGGGMKLDVPGTPARPVDATGAGDAVTAVLLAALSSTGYYPASLAAALPEAVRVAARTTEHWGALA